MKVTQVQLEEGLRVMVDVSRYNRDVWGNVTRATEGPELATSEIPVNVHMMKVLCLAMGLEVEDGATGP